MVNITKYYIGSYPTKELAERIYDIHAIKDRVFKAKINFSYISAMILIVAIYLILLLN